MTVSIGATLDPPLFWPYNTFQGGWQDSVPVEALSDFGVYGVSLYPMCHTQIKRITVSLNTHPPLPTTIAVDYAPYS